MTFKRKASGSWTDIATTIKRRASGAWVDIDLVRRRASGAWTVIWRRITLSNQSLTDTRPTGTAVSGYRLNTSGIAEELRGTSYSTLETWLTAGSASGYEARVTILSGTLSSGTSGSWLALSSSREWSVSQASLGQNICEFTVEIRNATTLVVAASATVQITADHT